MLEIFKIINAECDKVSEYLQNLNYDGRRVTECRKKLGFVGFLENTMALKWLYVDFIQSRKLNFFPTYKLSQDR